jgi:hypothetical protein
MKKEHGVPMSVLKSEFVKAWLKLIRKPVTKKSLLYYIEIPQGFEANRIDQASMKKLVANSGNLALNMLMYMKVFLRLK